MTTFNKLVSILFALVLSISMAFVPLYAFGVDLVEIDDDSAEAEEASDTDDADGEAGESTSFSDLFVLDQDGLLSPTVEYALDQRAATLADSQGIGSYFVTVGSLDGSNVKAFADKYYSTIGLGVGANKSGILCLVCFDETAYYVGAYGDASDKVSQSTLGTIGADVNSYLGRNDAQGAAETFYDDVEQALTGTNASSKAASNVSYTKGAYVIDDYGLFSKDEYSDLEAKAEAIAANYQMGAYLLVVADMGSSNPSSTQRTNFATNFYRQNNLGVGSGHDGIMLVIAVDSRDYVTIAYGQGSYSFSDEGISHLESEVTDCLGDNDWLGGAKAYYSTVDEQLAYYKAKGEPWTEPDFLSFILKILAILGIPGFVASSVVRGEKEAMKTAREKSEASSYLDRGSLVMTASSDQFVNTTLVATPRPKHEDSDSGFGGGGWGGGGGGGFSSSGGGKF